MTDVFIGTPTTRDFSPQYTTCLFRSRIHGRAYFTYVYGQAIDIGRNAVVQSFLKTDFEYLLMHDSDATWHEDAIERLASRKLPVVTAVIFKRCVPTVPTIGKFCGLSAGGHHMYSFADTMNRIIDRYQREKQGPENHNEQVFKEQPDDLQEIDGCGSHFMLIRRDVLEKIGAPWFECTSPNAGEDFDFCRKVQKAGFKLYVDYSVFTGHIAGPGLEIGAREFMLFKDKTSFDTAWEV